MGPYQPRVDDRKRVQQAVARRGPATGTVIAIAGGAALLPIAMYAQVTLM